MTDLKPEDLARLREIAEKATPGPWENGGSSVTNWHDHTFEMEWIPNGQDDEGEAEGVNSNADADGAFIAAFNPQVALSLLADRARMEKALREVVTALGPMMPIMFKHTPDYCELTFGEHRTQAMTVAPDDWASASLAYSAATRLISGASQ